MAEVRRYVTPAGADAVGRWLSRLRDTRARARVVARIDRLANDNFGDCKPVGGGVHELRIDYGPGYRVYFALIARQVVLLLCGGDKSTQTRDIAAAIRYFQDFKNRTRHDENPT